MKKYLILLFLLVFLLPAGQAKARPAKFVGIGLKLWYAEHPIRAAGKLLQATADTMGVAKKSLRCSVETVAKSATRSITEGVLRLAGLGPSAGSDSISSSGSGPDSSGSGGTNIDRQSYWRGRHDQSSGKEPPFSVNGSSGSGPDSSGSGTGGSGSGYVATSSGASSAGTYTVSSSGGGGGGGSWDGARGAICTYLSLPIVVQTSSKAQEIVVEMYDKEGKKMDGWFYRTILANGTSKEGVLFKQYKIRPNGQMLVPGKEYKYKVWAKAIGDDKGENRYLETDYLKPRCDTQTTLATLTFEKNTPTTQTTTEQEKKCYTYKEKGDDKEKYYYGTLAQFTKHIISLGSEKYSELISETAGNCPEDVEVIKAEEEEKPGSGGGENKPAEEASQEGTQEVAITGAGSGPGAETSAAPSP